MTLAMVTTKIRLPFDCNSTIRVTAASRWCHCDVDDLW